MRRAAWAAGLVIVAGLAACHPPQQAGSPPNVGPVAFTTTQLPDQPPVDGVYQGEVPYAGWRMPLPDGEWRVLSETTLSVRNQPVVGSIWFYRASGQAVSELLQVTPTLPTHLERITSAGGVCTSSDVLANDIRSVDADAGLDCWSVNFLNTAQFRSSTVVVTPGTNPAILFVATDRTTMFSRLDGHNLVVPATFIVAGVQITRGVYGVSAFWYRNPDLAGIAPDASPVRATNGWARTNLDRDPRKRAFVAAFGPLLERYRARWLTTLGAPPSGGGSEKFRTTWTGFAPSVGVADTSPGGAGGG